MRASLGSTSAVPALALATALCWTFSAGAQQALPAVGLAEVRVGIDEGDIRGSDQRALQSAVDYLAGLGGVRFVPIRFTPKASKFSGQECGGVGIVITDRGAFRPVATGLEIAYHLNKLFPGQWSVDDYLKLLVNRTALAGLKRGETPREIAAGWQTGLAEFAKVRQKYLIY